MIKRVTILFVLLVALTVSCKNQETTTDKKTITVSIPPQKFFVEQIAGETFNVNVMLPPGASPADYEPSPQQLQKLDESDIYFYIGHLGFEKSWMKKFSETAPDVSYISCSKGIDLLRGDPEQDVQHGDHVHYGTDPHIWTSPENVKTISRTIYTTLVQKHPDKEEEFKKNLNRFIAQIDTLDNTIRNTLLADSSKRSFMIFHPSLSYYARDYNLEQLSIEFEGKSPSPAHMKKMIDTATDKNIRTIFVQQQFETTKAQAVANAIEADVVTIDPLAENWLQEMYTLTEIMANAFSRK